MIHPDIREYSAVCSVTGQNHMLSEDRYRMLSRDIPLVARSLRGEVFAVFDGIGSTPRGREAAQVMADCLLLFYRQPQKYPASPEGIWALLMEANLIIHGWGFMDKEKLRPIGGAAGTVVWLFKDVLNIFQAGDTEAFVIRDQQTVAHTQVHQLDDGAIYRYFGMGPTLKSEICTYNIEEGDQILLASDGLTKLCDIDEIESIVANYPNTGRAVTELVKMAIKKGSKDDITVLMVEVEELWDDNRGNE